MNHCPTFSPLLWLLAGCALVLGACTAPSTLHTLQPVRQQPLGQAFSGFEEIILVMPVQLAPHLQGRGIVTQRAGGESHSSRAHLWSGPLAQQIGQQLMATLKDILATDRIALYPGPRFGTVRYQLEIELSEFSGNDQTFTTIGVWTLSDAVNKTILTRKTFRQTRELDTPDSSGYVASGSQAIADLGKEAAVALLAAHRSQPQPAKRP